MRDVIFISLENWDGVWRRNQFLCAEWLQRFPAMRLLFVGRTKDVSNAARTASREGLRRPTFEKSREFKGLSFLNPFKLLPNSFSLGRGINLRLLERQIRSAVKKAGLRSPLLWINDHCGEPLVGRLNERAVVYDITDDWTLMPAVGEEERELIRKWDARLCAKADLVVVCSRALERSRRGLCRKIITVPNGVDAAHYRSCLEPPKQALDQDQARVPVFGYLGTLHGDRLDLELVEELARARPEAKVVLCGPDQLTGTERKRLRAQPNVQLLAQVHYKSVPRIIAGFDVCILPHRCTPFTESLNPIKLWEYLASGKPVAATPVAGFRERAHLCHLGAGRDGFLAACDEALREDGSRWPARLREAEANSWKARSEQLLEVFRQHGWLGRPIPKPRRARVGGVAGSGAGTTESKLGETKGDSVWGGQSSLCETIL
ncbi:MAG: Glycosyltransferase involved in cell wall bisynthesis [Verrucomicrobia bacterium]|nr:MAG: Glycosyltransferase involved in cell wall bisynthesis [Verrucomicrobiota bacterium]